MSLVLVRHPRKKADNRKTHKKTPLQVQVRLDAFRYPLIAAY
jgi:hypothetical protein